MLKKEIKMKKIYKLEKKTKNKVKKYIFLVNSIM
jgi:hypothetical protein